MYGGAESVTAVPATVSALDAKLRNMEAKDPRYRPRWKFTDELCLAAYVQHLENEKRTAEASINTSLARIAELAKNNQGLSGKETEAKIKQIKAIRQHIQRQYSKWCVPASWSVYMCSRVSWWCVDGAWLSCFY